MKLQRQDSNLSHRSNRLLERKNEPLLLLEIYVHREIYRPHFPFCFLSPFCSLFALLTNEVTRQRGLVYLFHPAVFNPFSPGHYVAIFPRTFYIFLPPLRVFLAVDGSALKNVDRCFRVPVYRRVQTFTTMAGLRHRHALHDGQESSSLPETEENTNVCHGWNVDNCTFPRLKSQIRIPSVMED